VQVRGVHVEGDQGGQQLGTRGCDPARPARNIRHHGVALL
jgi:hypothetical protein